MKRLAVDIGGTFTDVVLAGDAGLTTTKVLTTYDDPANGVLAGVDEVLTMARVKPDEVGLVIHGTTLATNALIERRGAKTGLITTRGHRDVIEMAFENRFEQYDVNIDRPIPLVPRHWRIGIEERIASDGAVLVDLSEEQLLDGVRALVHEGVESLGIGFLHSYRNAIHERRAAELIRDEFPHLSLTLSCDVCPEIREYERFSTTVANAYVRPLMSDYLASLSSQLKGRGLQCQMLLMTSGGGLTTLATARRFPIRLVESGPAGGAMLAADVSRRHALEAVLSFDMGGTTAKICLIDEGSPLHSRAFEVDRSYRFKKGSGLPIRIPVVEMVEIGAGGGSLASIDALKRLRVGPTSAGSEPGPACYGRGGQQPTVSDADALLGRLSPDHFAGGKFKLDLFAAEKAVKTEIADSLSQSTLAGAYAISEIVEENMASAARAHASEWGLDLANRTMIAFGGAAPLHAVALARKLKINQVLIPAGAGVGSALGFLIAPIKFEVVRSEYMTLSGLEPESVKRIIAGMREEAGAVVDGAAVVGRRIEQINAYMRYAGQGYEVAVSLDAESLSEARLRAGFEAAYTRLYGRIIPDMAVEILSWTLSLEVAQMSTSEMTMESAGRGSQNVKQAIRMFDGAQNKQAELVTREAVTDEPLHGPALVVEDQTSIVVPEGVTCQCLEDGSLMIRIVS
jgi:N-methylhydantoinase A